jgi:hypothetical protein
MADNRVVNELFKILKDGVSSDQLLEANKTAYSCIMECTVGDKVNVIEGDGRTWKVEEVDAEGSTAFISDLETGKDGHWADLRTLELVEGAPVAVEGKLPDDPSAVKDPEKDIQALAEGEKKEEKGAVETAKPAAVKEEPVTTKIEQDMHAATPDIAAKTDVKAAAGMAQKTDEGKLPDDPSAVKDPEKEIQMLAEGERPFTTVSDEAAAKEIMGKFPGSRYEKNQQGAFTIYIKETATTEPKAEKVSDTVPEVKAEKNTDKLTNEDKVAEEKTTEPKAEKVTDTVPDVKAEKDTSKLTAEAKTTEPTDGKVTDTVPGVKAEKDTGKLSDVKAENEAKTDEKVCDESYVEDVEVDETKAEHRGKVVFQSDSPKVKDKKDHFPINDADQARNALARVNQYSSVPSWYAGSLAAVKNAVRRKVKAEYPSIEVSEALLNEGKAELIADVVNIMLDSNIALQDVTTEYNQRQVTDNDDVVPAEGSGEEIEAKPDQSAEPLVNGGASEAPMESITDVQATEIAEKLFVVEFLESQQTRTAKQESFIAEAKKIKVVGAAKQKVDNALGQLKTAKK